MVDKGEAFPGTVGLTSWLHSNYISRGSRRGKFSKKKKRGRESWRSRRTSCSAGVAMLSSLLKQNMNANISSANRWGAPETLCWFSHPVFLLFLNASRSTLLFEEKEPEDLLCSLLVRVNVSPPANSLADLQLLFGTLRGCDVPKIYLLPFLFIKFFFFVDLRPLKMHLKILRS